MALSAEISNINLSIDPPKPPKEGGGAWPLEIDKVEEWAWHEDWFTPEELDAIIALGEYGELDQAWTGGGLTLDKRDSHVRFLFPNEDSSWIFAKMAGLITGMNDMWFGFDLTGMEQGIQYTRYSAESEQHYDWHVDRGGKANGIRKLSFSLQLSDPEDYDGGELELSFGSDPLAMPKKRGRVTAFPSWTMHRVKPVTRGVRRSLVVWVSGPSFR